VVMDITNMTLEEIGPNQVRVSGVRGKEKPDDLKVVMGYKDGYMGQVIVGYSWPDALKKAKKTEEIIYKELENKGLEYDRVHVDYVGYNSLHGPLAHADVDPNEIYLRIAVQQIVNKRQMDFLDYFLH